MMFLSVPQSGISVYLSLLAVDQRESGVSFGFGVAFGFQGLMAGDCRLVGGGFKGNCAFNLAMVNLI